MNDERIEELSGYVKYWEDTLKAVENIRDRLLQDKELGFVLNDENGNDVLPERIEMVEESVTTHEEILTRMSKLRDKASSGEDV